MGGFTQVFLKDTSRTNIDSHNAKLEIKKVPQKYRYSSDFDTIIEYEYFKEGKGAFPEDQFPKDKINSLEDFKKYWSPEALGEIFVAPTGTLQFDCYFGRTSKRAMRNIGKYLAENSTAIKKVSGSFSTFCERGMTKLEQQIMKEHGFLNE